jgi:hypothetical protein
MDPIVIDIVLIIHFAGLMLGAGGGLGSTIVMAQARAMPPEQAGPLRSVGPALARMSTLGLVLLLLSGPALVSMKYGGFANMPTMFWVKLVFVGTLTLAAILIEVAYARVKKGDVKAAGLLPKLGPMAGISSLLAVIFAALAFH